MEIVMSMDMVQMQKSVQETMGMLARVRCLRSYADARAQSIKRWKVTAETGVLPDGQCPMCQHFDRGRGNFCKRCPLHWPDAKAEAKSKYDGFFHLPCCREYWHYRYWVQQKDMKRMKYWAKRVLKRLKATPRRLK